METSAYHFSKLKKIALFLTVVVLSFALVLVFAACGRGKNNSDVVDIEDVPSVKNVVLMIGDGMGQNHVKSGERVKGAPLVMQTFPEHTLVNTNNINSPTDSAAAATAYATGQFVKNKVLSVDEKGNEFKTIMDHAKEQGKATGVLTTDKLYGATPSAFSGHAKKRDETDKIIRSQTTSGVNLLAGIKSDSYTSTYRADFEANGYTVLDAIPNDEAGAAMDEAAASGDVSKVLALLDFKIGKDGSGTVALKDAARWALETLSADDDGFVLMIEGAKIDSFSHDNDFDNMLNELFAFDEAVEVVLEWAKARSDTAVFVTADHETGGLTLTDKSPFYKFKKTGHSADNVFLFMYGVKLEKEADVVQNISVFTMMLSIVETKND